MIPDIHHSWEENPNVTRFPAKLKLHPTLRETYKVARTVLTAQLLDTDRELFLARSWEKESVNDKIHLLRSDLERYQTAIEEMGRRNDPNQKWDRLVAWKKD